MKYLLKFLLLVYILSIHCFSKTTEWDIVFSNDSLLFKGIDNADSLYCIAIASSREYSKIILKSTDAGLTWNYILKDTYNLGNGKLSKTITDISYPTRDFCIIGLDTNSFIKTTDGGITWNEYKINLPYWLFGFNDIDMYDSINGVMATQHDLAISHDGFKTWKTFSAPNDSTILKVDMAAPNSICVVSRYLNDSPDYDKKFFRSDDGGYTWNEYEHPDYYIYQLMFIDSLTGFTVGDRNTGHGDERYNLVYKTTDGGHSWFNVLDTEIYHSFGLQKVDFFDKDNGITVGQFGSVFWTYDGGKSWFYDSNNIFWSHIPPMMNVCYIRRDRAIIADFDGIIYISSEDTTDVIEEITSGDDFVLYPNPATDKIKIKLKDEFINSREIKIFNSYGYVIMNKSATDFRLTTNDFRLLEVDISSLSNGVYFIVLRGSSKVISIPFVVIR